MIFKNVMSVILKLIFDFKAVFLHLFYWYTHRHERNFKGFPKFSRSTKPLAAFQKWRMSAPMLLEFLQKKWSRISDQSEHVAEKSPAVLNQKDGEDRSRPCTVCSNGGKHRDCGGIWYAAIVESVAETLARRHSMTKASMNGDVVSRACCTIRCVSKTSHFWLVMILTYTIRLR